MLPAPWRCLYQKVPLGQSMFNQFINLNIHIYCINKTYVLIYFINTSLWSSTSDLLVGEATYWPSTRTKSIIGPNFITLFKTFWWAFDEFLGLAPVLTFVGLLKNLGTISIGCIWCKSCPPQLSDSPNISLWILFKFLLL